MLSITQFSACPMTGAVLGPAPIDPAWVHEGNPVARNLVIAGSTDRSAWTMLWDCTAGKFEWHYTVDETVHILEGGVTVSAAGVTKTLGPGDVAYFPAGSSANWHVENYVRKIAFCQKPDPLIFALPLRAVRKLLG